MSYKDKSKIRINMNYWIFPWNKNEFDLYRYLKNDGSLEWRQTANPDVGDIVFLYSSFPISQIIFMAKVTDINIPFQESVYGDNTRNCFKSIKASRYCFRMNIIHVVDHNNQELAFKQLKANGLNSQLQGPEMVKNSLLLTHILDNLDVSFDKNTGSYVEGEAIRRSVTSYERNLIARDECIKKYGYTCQVCGINFEEKYGEVGKNFIHVHHGEFISSFKGIEHEINPIDELKPVCPNCHAMLHRKVKGKYLSMDDLKASIK